jgi:hypothetical protein
MTTSRETHKSKDAMSSSNTGHGIVIPVRLRLPYKGKEQPHEALVNLRDDPAATKAFTDRYESSAQVQYRPIRSHKFVIAIRDWFRKAWRGEEGGVQWVQAQLDAEEYAITVRNNQVVMETKSLFGTMSLLFMRDYAAGKIAVCANPDCHSPFFIKKRKTQIYCTAGQCTEQAQREQKRLWWERNHGKGAS